MRRFAPSQAHLPSNKNTVHFWSVLNNLVPYLSLYWGRLVFALICLVIAKLANVGVPLIFKQIIDQLGTQQAILIAPFTLIAAYGVLKFSVSLFTELREVLFARITHRAVSAISLAVFGHLHNLSLRFHLERQTGGLTRDIERGTRAIGSLITFTVYSVLPTLVEITLVLGLLASRYDIAFSLIAASTLFAYIGYTILVTNWRTKLRRVANEHDTAANSRAIDSLLNYETVKYFNNEHFESRRYGEQLSKWEDAMVKSQVSLSYLNLGQAAIIAVGVSLMMWQAILNVQSGAMTVGDIVLVNVLMLQLYMPLNFLGVLYREIRQSLIDIEQLFSLLNEHREIQDEPDATPLAPGSARVSFDHVDFAYDSSRPILHDVIFDIPVGKTLAVVGHSGAGKSTLSRLLFRFYDVSKGAIRINGTDIRKFTQASLRARIGIVPQDTVLFNDTLYYNIQYGRPDASHEDIIEAARAAHLHDFVARLPQGYDTRVGERGLKLSGGEKQRVAIARALLKQPSLLIFDEATSALDSNSEKAIQTELERIAQGRTTLVIAHRLSTVMKADEILVLDQGRVIERGTHRMLLESNGAYAQLWAIQQQEEIKQ